MPRAARSHRNPSPEPAAPKRRKVGRSATPDDVFRLFETRTAQNSAAYLLPALRSIRRRNPRMTLLDVGCGPGSLSASFAELLGPTGGRVTAVDASAAVLERARSVVAAGKYGVPVGDGIEEDWISFRIADAHALPFGDDTFDVVHCHQVLAHNGGQPEILREMLRVAKPGGVVAAREADMETEVFWPPLPGLVKFHNDLELRVIRARGASTRSGRELLSWALKANGGDRSKIATSFSAWSYTEPEDRELWATGMIDATLSSPAVREYNVKSGLTEAEMDEMRDAWIEWRDRDDATLSMVHGEIIMRK
ncbi:hypothetical protein Hte_012366 [Hypoxylon texense]